MTREGENETSFAQNATLLRICTSRKEREAPPAPLRAWGTRRCQIRFWVISFLLPFHLSQRTRDPSTSLRASSFDSAQGRLHLSVEVFYSRPENVHARPYSLWAHFDFREPGKLRSSVCLVESLRHHPWEFCEAILPSTSRTPLYW